MTSKEEPNAAVRELRPRARPHPLRREPRRRHVPGDEPEGKRFEVAVRHRRIVRQNLKPDALLF
ncbi:MAG TPA: hypothetical protein VGJ77_00335 [Gaiellaceae bacterium]